MQRTLAILIPLSILFSATTFAAEPPVAEAAKIVARDRFVVGVEGHFFRPTQTDLDFIETVDTNSGATTLRYLNPDYATSGGRIFTSYMYSDKSDLRVAWSHEQNSDSAGFTSDATHHVSAISAVFPGLYESEDPRAIPNINTVDLHTKITMSIIDFDIGRLFYDENYSIRFFSGLRYATIEDDIAMLSIFNSGGTATVHAKGHSEMKAIGPRGGFDAHYRLMDHLSVTGHAGAALLLGRTHTHSHWHDVDNFGQGSVVDFQSKADTIERLIPNLDARVGLAADFRVEDSWGITIEGGVHADHLFNASTIIGVHDGAGKSVTRDVSEYGPYLGLSILFS